MVLKLLANKVDEAEGVILKVLNGMEVSQVNAAEERANQVSELHRTHLKDVVLQEQVRTLLNNASIQVRLGASSIDAPPARRAFELPQSTAASRFLPHQLRCGGRRATRPPPRGNQLFLLPCRRTLPALA
jgi:hypothetical protein